MKVKMHLFFIQFSSLQTERWNMNCVSSTSINVCSNKDVSATEESLKDIVGQRLSDLKTADNHIKHI